jgi:hypothetical protein
MTFPKLDNQLTEASIPGTPFHAADKALLNNL